LNEFLFEIAGRLFLKSHLTNDKIIHIWREEGEKAAICVHCNVRSVIIKSARIIENLGMGMNKSQIQW